MLVRRLSDSITNYSNFPKEGIDFKDLNPILSDPELFHDLINKTSSSNIFSNSDAIIAIDARGFIYGSAIAYKLKMPLVLARKKNKLPGKLISKSYGLEYGKDELSIQKSTIKNFKRIAIVDDLLATGGTAACICELLNQINKEISGLVVIVELIDLKGRDKLSIPVYSELSL